MNQRRFKSSLQSVASSIFSNSLNTRIEPYIFNFWAIRSYKSSNDQVVLATKMNKIQLIRIHSRLNPQ